MPTGKKVFNDNHQLLAEFLQCISGAKTKEQLAKEYGCTVGSIEKNFKKVENKYPDIKDFCVKDIKDIFFNDETKKGRFQYEPVNNIPFQVIDNDALTHFFIEAFRYFTDIESKKPYSNLYMILIEVGDKIHINILEDRLIYEYSKPLSSDIKCIKYIRILIDWKTTEIKIFKRKKKEYREKKLSSNVDESYRVIKEYLSKFNDIIFPNFIHMSCLSRANIRFNIYNGEEEENTDEGNKK